LYDAEPLVDLRGWQFSVLAHMQFNTFNLSPLFEQIPNLCQFSKGYGCLLLSQL